MVTLGLSDSAGGDSGAAARGRVVELTGIMVIGGGIAGSAAALALHKAGFEVTVYEAHPDTGADIGAFLTLASNGMRALAQIDAATPVCEIGFPITTMSLVDAAGAELATVPLGEHAHPVMRYRCLRRAELGTALQQEVRRRGIAIRHAARLTTLTEDAASITATFANGTSATGDLAVGADGLHSTVRTHLDPASPGSSYAGQSVFYGYTTQAVPPCDVRDRITMIRGSGAAFGYLVSPAGETFWFARVPGSAVTAEEITRGAAWPRASPSGPRLRGGGVPGACRIAPWWRGRRGRPTPGWWRGRLPRRGARR